MPTSSPSNLIQNLVRPKSLTSTTDTSSSPQSGNWLRLGDTWVVRQEHLILLADLGGYGRVQAYLDVGQVIEIEVNAGHGPKVVALIRDGKDVPQAEIKNISVGPA